MKRMSEALILPDDTEFVQSGSIEICVVENVSSVMLQVMQALGVTKERLDASMDFYAQAAGSLSLMMLALIKISGGDYSKPLPPPAEFKKIVDEIATQNAYSVEYDVDLPTETG